MQKTRLLDPRIKIAFLDLETSSLVADFGIILVGCVKPLGESTKIFRIDKSPGYQHKKWEDKFVTKQIRDELDKYDVIVTFYGKRFDVPFLTTRLLINGLEFLEKRPHIDYYFTSRFKLKMNRNSLMATARACLGKTNKTHCGMDIWLRAQTGDKKSLNYIVDHCVRDVCDLERIHKKLMPLLPDKITK